MPKIKEMLLISSKEVSTIIIHQWHLTNMAKIGFTLFLLPIPFPLVSQSAIGFMQYFRAIRTMVFVADCDIVDRSTYPDKMTGHFRNHIFDFLGCYWHRRDMKW
jgi:hypothetical protein